MNNSLIENVFKMLYRLGIDNALVSDWGFNKNGVSQYITDLDELMRYRDVLNDRNKKVG